MTIGDDVLLCSWFYVLVNLSFGKFEGSSIGVEVVKRFMCEVRVGTR